MGPGFKKSLNRPPEPLLPQIYFILPQTKLTVYFKKKRSGIGASRVPFFSAKDPAWAAKGLTREPFPEYDRILGLGKEKESVWQSHGRKVGTLKEFIP